MTPINKVKMEILEEWDKEFGSNLWVYKAMNGAIPQADSIRKESKDFLSQSLNRLQASIVERIISELKDSLERGYELKTTVEALEARMTVEDLLNPNRK